MLSIPRCMKDGKLAEQGTHDDLMLRGGEYYKLHNVQAQAFLPVRFMLCLAILVHSNLIVNHSAELKVRLIYICQSLPLSSVLSGLLLSGPVSLHTMNIKALIYSLTLRFGGKFDCHRESMFELFYECIKSTNPLSDLPCEERVREVLVFSATPDRMNGHRIPSTRGIEQEKGNDPVFELPREVISRYRYRIQADLADRPKRV